VNVFLDDRAAADLQNYSEGKPQMDTDEHR
jgi:hypothetical protein